MKTRTTRRLLTALLAAAASWPATAQAGEYDINACAVPGKESTSQGVWTAYQTGDPAFLQMPITTCAGSGFFGREDTSGSISAYPYFGGVAGVGAEVPPGKNIDIRRVHLRGRVSYTKPSDSAGTLWTAATPGDFTLCGASEVCDSTWDMPFPAGTKDVVLGVACRTGGNCKSGKTYRQEWKWAVLTAEESGKPVLASVGGALVSGEPQRMVRQLTYTATDGESGVARVQVRLGGVLVGDDDARGDVLRCHHHGWAACPATANGTVELDTRLAGEGEQPLTLTITDAAGNVTEAAAGTVLVDNMRVPTVAQAPAVAGTAMVGEVLTGTLGKFTGATPAAPAVRFKRCDASGCSAIPGATDTTYRLTSEDVGKQIVFAVTAVNGADEPTTAESARTATVVARPDQPAGGGNGNGGGTGAGGGGAGAGSGAKPGGAGAGATGDAGGEGGGAGAGATTPPPGTPNGTPASPNARLVVKLTDDRTTRRVAFGKAATIRGTLADESGRPVAGARLTVTARVRRTGAKPQARPPVTTNARGEFTLVVPKGPSRDLTFGYRAFAGAADVTATRTVTVLVASKLALRATPRRLANRERVRFTGTVKGKPTGKHGPLVDLQVLVDGKWRSFLKGAVRADRNGRFKASYRFLRTTRPATYTFRAVARQDSAYPYVANASPRITVRVVPNRHRPGTD